MQEEGGWIDALVVWPPLVTLEKASLLYATKIVEFKGVTATVRSNFLPVSFDRKPKDEGTAPEMVTLDNAHLLQFESSAGCRKLFIF